MSVGWQILRIEDWWLKIGREGWWLRIEKKIEGWGLKIVWEDCRLSHKGWVLKIKDGKLKYILNIVLVFL